MVDLARVFNPPPPPSQQNSVWTALFLGRCFPYISCITLSTTSIDCCSALIGQSRSREGGKWCKDAWAMGGREVHSWIFTKRNKQTERKRKSSNNNVVCLRFYRISVGLFQQEGSFKIGSLQKTLYLLQNIISMVIFHRRGKSSPLFSYLVSALPAFKVGLHLILPFVTDAIAFIGRVFKSVPSFFSKYSENTLLFISFW